MNFKNYNSNGFYDELLKDNLQARIGARKLLKQLQKLNQDEINRGKLAAELAIKTMGISFMVYSEGKNIDRDWPYDIIPRIFPSREWVTIEKGLEQRLAALNHFINDIYNEQKIIKDEVIPKDILKTSKNFREECIGMQPVFGVWAHICGSAWIN